MPSFLAVFKIAPGCDSHVIYIRVTPPIMVILQYNQGIRETTDWRHVAKLQEKKKKSLTTRVKCQHYHTFLIGCFVSTFFCFTITQWMACWKTVLPQRSVAFRISRAALAAAQPGRVSSERTLICSQLAAGATGINALGVISSVAAHASLGARTT